MPVLIRRRSRRGAFAMPLMLVVLMVLTTITVVLVGTSARDVESSRTSAGRTEARLLAASVLEDIYARIRENPQEAFTFASNGAFSSTSGFANYKALRTQSTPSVWAVLPTGLRDGSSVDPLGASGKSIGSVECPNDFSRDCFFVRVKNPTGAASRPGAFTVYVGLRLRCGGVESRCVYAAFEQRLRRAQFYDFALAQEYATLAPEALFPAGSWDAGKGNESAYRSYGSGCSTAASRRPNFTATYTVELGDTDYVSGTFAGTGEEIELSGCIDIAYTSGDNLGEASVYSGDEYLSLCGTPSFSRVYLAGGGTIPNSSDNAWWKKPDFCDPAVATAGNATPQFNFPVMALPTAATLAPVNTASAPDRGSAGKPVVVDLVSSSNVTVVKGDGNPATLDAVVYGNVSGQKSVIVVNGSVAVIGDVKYTNEATDSFSLTASERIEIWQSCSEGTGTPPAPSTFGDPTKDPRWSNSASCVPGGPTKRTVQGILTSPEGFIGVPDWLTNFEDGRNQASLEFFGSMASKYQGVFGSFGADGKLLSGFKKDFTHDARFTKFVNGAPAASGFALPPFVVESEIPVWLRLDLSEVGYSES